MTRKHDEEGLDARSRILDAAASEFLMRGYGSARLAQVAKDAGVSRSTLYKFFPGKQQLLSAINELVMEEGLRQASTILASGGDPAEVLREWFRSAIHLSGRYRTLLRIVHSDETQPNFLIDRENVYRAVNSAQKIIRSVLRKGVSGGVFRKDINVSKVAHSLQNIHYLLTKQAAAAYPLIDFGEDDGETTIDLIVRGLLV